MESNEYKYEDLDESERDMMHFMAKRLGFDHFIIAGYDSTEFRKHVLTRGLHPIGAPKISVCGTLAGMTFILSRLLLDFEFSHQLRRSVMSVLNSVLTGREMQKHGQKSPKRD